MAIDTHTPYMGLRLADEDTDIDLGALQGSWSEEQYFKLTDQTNRLIEFTDGYLEVLPMPTERHQAMLEFLFLALRTFIERLGGKVRFAALRMQLRDGKFREPDILHVRDASDPRRQNDFWLGADLVVEIVSPDNPERDTMVKRVDYAEAGIPEYWIGNPIDETISVLKLATGSYIEHGIFRRGETAASALLDGFSVRVDHVFDAT